MHNKYLVFLVLSAFTLGNCKNSDENSEDDGGNKKVSAREKLEMLDSVTLIEGITDKIDKIEGRINSVNLIVNYDDDGNMWLAGIMADNVQKVTSLDELSEQLAAMSFKGEADITHVNGVSSRNKQLEKLIREELKKRGFNAR